MAIDIATLAYAISETMVTLPGLALCVACIWDLPRTSHRGLLAASAASLAVLALTGVASYALGVSTQALFIPCMLLLGLLLVRPSGLPARPFVYVAASGAVLSACIANLSLVAETGAGNVMGLYLGPVGAAAQWIASLVMVALLWVPVHRHGPELLASPIATSRFWKMAWIVPVTVFVALALAIPRDPLSLTVSGINEFFAIQTCVLTAMFLLVQILLWLLARQARANEVARERTRHLEMFSMQADHFDRRIQEAREARHDLRQHARVLSSLADAGDLDHIRAYIHETMGALADPEPLLWCQNVAVNAVVSFYLNRAIALGARVDARLDLPAQLGQSQADVVVVVGNLLENALEALETQTGGELELTVRAHGGPSTPLVLTVDNSCTHAPASTPDGRLLSSKHAGLGIGTESVRLAAEAYGGEARFAYANGRFEASVLLAASAVQAE